MSGSLDFAIGIDLGTTNSCVAIYLDGKAEVLTNEEGERTTPSYVGFRDDGILVGKMAKEQAYRNSKNTIFDVKRLMGQKYNDEKVQEQIKLWPFVLNERRGNPELKIELSEGERFYWPEQISAKILEKLKDVASKKVEVPVTKAVITVPAYFNDSQRQATKDAGKLAGLEVLMLLNEPTAAAITYAYDKSSRRAQEESISETKDCQHSLVYDLGGGTFDVSIIKFENRHVTVKATHGDCNLGGIDFDWQLVTYVLEDIDEKFNNNNLRDDQRNMARLLAACERAKRTLSFEPFAEIELDALVDEEDYCINLTREKFEELNKELIQKTLKIVGECLEIASFTYSDIDNVVLVGGSTRIPQIRELLQDLFKDTNISEAVNPDEAVAIGAAMQAANLINNKSEVVKDFILKEVVPFTLGIAAFCEGKCELMVPLIKRNTLLPATVTKRFSTHTDNQASVGVEIFEGEDEFSWNNRLLGSFLLTGINPAPRNVPDILVTLDIDVNGILNVTAVDESSNNTNNITITNDRGHLSQEEINNLMYYDEDYCKRGKRNELK